MTGPTTIRDDTARRHERKYKSRNPFQRLVLDRFFDAVAHEIEQLQPRKTLEFGCGEGFFLQKLKERSVRFPELLGIDLRPEALESARRLNPEYRFECIDLMTWDIPAGSFDLVIASQVLEHLPDPEPYLKRLAELSCRHVLLTVPWEPWFRIMNLIRGRDLARLGNHPEHVNLWGLSAFTSWVSTHLKIVRAYTVFPFTIVVADVRNESKR